MKTGINFTDYLSSCLKRQSSQKSTSHLKMGLTVNTFHTNNTNLKTGKKHTRTKTDQLCQPDTMSTTSVFVDGKLRTCENQLLKQKEKRQRKKTHSEIQLKKANSYKAFQPHTHTQHIKTFSSNTNPQKSSLPLKQPHQEYHRATKSIQKLRQTLNQSNPQLCSQQLKQISSSFDKKSTTPGTLTHEYYLLSTDLLETIKKMQRKHTQEVNVQKEIFQRREQKLVGKIVDLERKNQRCSTLINQLRMRNIDVDGIWHEEGLNSKTNDLMVSKK